MAKTKTRKFSEEHPTMVSIRKYESEIEALEQKRDAANAAHDWTMRNFYANQIEAKRVNMEILIVKYKKHYQTL